MHEQDGTSAQKIQHPWVERFPAAVTVCDRDGTILEMNERSAEMFQQEGGVNLIGSNLLACHPEEARATVQHLLETGALNVYTIEKAGKKKLIYQSPWYDAEGRYAGLVEIALPLPDHVPHHLRS